MWHTHPGMATRASLTDDQAMRDLLVPLPAAQVPRRAIQVILGGDGEKWDYWLQGVGQPDIGFRLFRRSQVLAADGPASAGGTGALMSLSDNQITKWSRRGDPIHAWYSYEMVRDSLAAAQLNGMTYTIYPQGSYANKTNIAADSDVDMVIALRSAFYPDKEELKPAEREEYARHYERSDLTWQRFREAVVRALQSNYLVQEKSKCVKVRSNLIRLPADVLIALDYRYYTSFPSFLRADLH